MYSIFVGHHHIAVMLTISQIVVGAHLTPEQTELFNNNLCTDTLQSLQTGGAYSNVDSSQPVVCRLITQCTAQARSDDDDGTPIGTELLFSATEP